MIIDLSHLSYSVGHYVKWILIAVRWSDVLAGERTIASDEAIVADIDINGELTAVSGLSLLTN
jgi:hypothetical protein